MAIQPTTKFAGHKFVAVVLIGIFLIGLICRFLVLNQGEDGAPQYGTRWQPDLFLPLLEYDEKIYIALVNQLDNGKGYTLQGHPILNEPWIDLEQYDRPLFYHPPGGVELFRLSHWIIGEAGYALIQMICFAIFYWSMLLLGWLTLKRTMGMAMLTLGLLSAFTPIMAHVMGRLWLDGPLLAFSTLAIAIYLLGIRRNSTVIVCLAGLLMGYASLIKLTALLVIPGGVVLAWSLSASASRRALARYSSLFVMIAIAIQLPWEFWQWRAVGSPFPSWAGKPSDSLVRTNSYVFMLTVRRPPWAYAVLLPQVTWTLLPALILLALQCRNHELLKRGTALFFWITVVVGINIILGAMGYAKILRYVILVTPATLLLCALVMDGLAKTMQRDEWLIGGMPSTVASLILLIVGIGLEVTQGLVTSLIDNRTIDLVRPLPILKMLLS